jgi:hypothetical protein
VEQWDYYKRKVMADTIQNIVVGGGLHLLQDLPIQFYIMEEMEGKPVLADPFLRHPKDICMHILDKEGAEEEEQQAQMEMEAMVIMDKVKQEVLEGAMVATEEMEEQDQQAMDKTDKPDNLQGAEQEVSEEGDVANLILGKMLVVPVEQEPMEAMDRS